MGHAARVRLVQAVLGQLPARPEAIFGERLPIENVHYFWLRSAKSTIRLADVV